MDEDAASLLSPSFLSPRYQLAYYSTHGDIARLAEDRSMSSNNKIKMALVFIHGSSRNGDDYFCSGTKMIELWAQQELQYGIDPNVLLIAPQFYDQFDNIPTDGSKFLYWKSESGEPWRYGADALNVNVSSFEAIDQLVGTLQKIPTLEHITVLGHSAGGQFVQRWTLLSPQFIHNGKMHSVVANPTSYAYLIPKRYIDGSWQIPTRSTDCPHYNQWEWGLDNDGNSIRSNIPYIDRILSKPNATNMVIGRYVHQRHVVYMVGGQDRCNVTGHDKDGWCYSHGLGTNCADLLQGSNRYERSQRYYESLQNIILVQPRWTSSNKTLKNHLHYVVRGVGHDHSLMFQSEVGLHAVFEDFVTLHDIKDSTTEDDHAEEDSDEIDSYKRLLQATEATRLRHRITLY